RAAVCRARRWLFSARLAPSLSGAERSLDHRRRGAAAERAGAAAQKLRLAGAGAAVAIFEAHHVVELWRRDFDDIGVGDGDHAVAQAGVDVKRLERLELDGARRRALFE